MSLDDKLREIGMDFYKSHGGLIDTKETFVLADETIAQIQQAFIAEGWIDPFKVLQSALGEAPVPTEDRYGVDENGKVFGPTKELMTGQEWYDRFMDGLPKPHKIRKFKSDTWWTIQEIMKAAERATGIT